MTDQGTVNFVVSDSPQLRNTANASSEEIQKLSEQEIRTDVGSMEIQILSKKKFMADAGSEESHNLPDNECSAEPPGYVAQGLEEEGTGDKDGLESDGVPYDRSWAWAVVFGCFIHYSIYNGYMKCYSLFYVELIHRFNTQATEAALFFSLRTAVLSVCSLFVMNIVVGHLGERKTVLVGGLMVSLSGILSSMVNDVMAIMFLQGCLLGLGQAMLCSPGEVLMGAYFKKKRALAMALAKCGASIGGIVMPLLVTFFLQKYALSGGLLLTGGVCLHAIPTALLLRPTSYFKKLRIKQVAARNVSVKYQTVEKNQETTTALVGNDHQIKNRTLKTTVHIPVLETEQSENFSLNKKTLKESPLWFPSRTGFCEAAENSVVHEKYIQHGSLSKLSENGKEDTETGQESSYPDKIPQGSTADPLSNVAMIVHGSCSKLSSSIATCRSPDYFQQTDADAGYTADQKEGLHSPLTKKRLTKCPKASSFMLDFSLFRSPLFRLLLAFYLLFQTANIMNNYLPALASENGVTDYENGLLLSIIGGLDLVCRIMCAIIAQSKILRVSSMNIISYFTLGVTSQFVVFLTSFHHFLAMSILLGLVGGVGNATLPILVLDFVGLQNMAKALGFVMLAAGVGATASFPLLGYIRDTTGSYVAVYHVTGAGALVAAGFLCCEKFVRRLEKKAENGAEV